MTRDNAKQDAMPSHSNVIKVVTANMKYCVNWVLERMLSQLVHAPGTTPLDGSTLST